jgi:orotidine-5'-phosphate decarboxylase
MNPILIALDVDTPEQAHAMADTLRGSVGGYKINTHLFTGAGPDVVRAFVERGDRVFLDLKFHDIPNTVAGAVGASAALGVWMVNVHACGGPAMLRAARRGADEGSQRRGAAPPLVIAVTVLTSIDAGTLTSLGVAESPAAHVTRLARMAQDAGLDGVVASPQEVRDIRRACGADFVIVTPGIRGGSALIGPDDQQRTATPAGAIEAGSSYLVVGRPITAAANPRAAADAIAEEVAKASAGS